MYTNATYEWTLGRGPRASVQETNVVPNLHLIRCTSPGEADFVRNSCQLVFEELERNVAPHSLGLVACNVQLHGCILIGPFPWQHRP